MSQLDTYTVALETPTTTAQRLVDPSGAVISQVVTDDVPDPVADLEAEEYRLSQGQSGPQRFVTQTGAPVDLSDDVLMPYSLTTPPGAIVVG